MLNVPLKAYKEFLLGSLLVALFSLLGNQRGQDWLVLALANEREPDDRIVLVTIDDESLSQLQDEWGKWPWDRSLHAFLLEQMLAAGARTVAYDILFSQPDLYRPDGDLYLNEVLETANNVVLATAVLNAGPMAPGVAVSGLPDSLGLINRGGGQFDTPMHLDLPWAIHLAQWQLGAVNFTVDPDGIGRRYARYLSPSKSDPQWILPTLAGKQFQQAVEKTFRHAQEPMTFGLNWRSRQEMPYPSISYSELYHWFEQGDELAFRKVFANRHVIVGATAAGLFDARHTLISPAQPGLVVHATALDNLLNQDYYRTGSILWNILLVLPILFFVARPSALKQFAWKLLTNIGVWLVTSALILLVSYVVALNYFVLLPWSGLSQALASVLTMQLLWVGWQHYRQSQKTLDTFGRFMEPKVVSLLTRQQKLEPAALTQRCEITVLFTDIRGFTTLSENKSAEQVIDLLNQYFTGQVREIFSHQGTFDKYIGDAVMAFWGAPVADEHHALNAVRCALAMIKALEVFKQSLGPEGQDFDIGIGLHSGPAVVGMLGSEQRYDYTAIGDTVNVASRIEGQTKGRARLLISENTRELIDEHFVVRSHGFVALKGRGKQVELFEIVRSKNGEEIER